MVSTQVVKAPWDAPVEVHDAGKPGSIRCVQAGMYASALVTSDGDLLMWGRLVDRSTYDVLMQRATALKGQCVACVLCEFLFREQADNWELH